MGEVGYVMWKLTNKATLSKTTRVWQNWPSGIKNKTVGSKLEKHFLFNYYVYIWWRPSFYCYQEWKLKMTFSLWLVWQDSVFKHKYPFPKVVLMPTGKKKKKKQMLISATHTYCELELEGRPLKEGPTGVITASDQPIRAFLLYVHTVD